MLSKLLTFLILCTSISVFFAVNSDAGPPVPIEGACCINVPSGECITADSEPQCNMQGGFFFASETCAENPCDEPTDSTGDCCVDSTAGGMPTFTTGCNNSECELAVCQEDAFCCLVFWDNQCVDEAQQLCGSLCPGGTPGPQFVVPTMGQWGMITVTVLLGFFAVITLRRKKQDNS